MNTGWSDLLENSRTRLNNSLYNVASSWMKRLKVALDSLISLKCIIISTKQHIISQRSFHRKLICIFVYSRTLIYFTTNKWCFNWAEQNDLKGNNVRIKQINIKTIKIRVFKISIRVKMHPFSGIVQTNTSPQLGYYQALPAEPWLPTDKQIYKCTQYICTTQSINKYP